MAEIGAYKNIPQEDGVECMNEALNARKDQTIPSEFYPKLWNKFLNTTSLSSTLKQEGNKNQSCNGSTSTLKQGVPSQDFLHSKHPG